MKLIPTGIENFKTMIDKNAYYVDKTNLIADILNEQVVLYTRPRRFGKTLNMSMLYYFFSIKEKENAYLFNDLYISKNKEALEHQNKYPTIFISLKEMKNLTFDAQISSFSSIIYELLEKNLEILSMKKLFYIQDLEDLVRHLICPCFIISFPLKKRKILIYLII